MSIICLAQLRARDSVMTTSLVRSGVKMERRNVIVYFPNDSLSSQRMIELTEEWSRGVTAAFKYVGDRSNRKIEQPVVFYVGTGRFISHASPERDVFVPLWRVKSNQVPWLHEVMHAILHSDVGNWDWFYKPEVGEKMPGWILEGLAEYLALIVSHETGMEKFDLFGASGYTKIDSVARVALNSEHGSYVLSFIASDKLELPELAGERRRIFAPLYYNLSASFTKYIAEHYSLEPLFAGVASVEVHATIEKHTNKSMQALKDEWLGYLKGLK